MMTRFEHIRSFNARIESIQIIKYNMIDKEPMKITLLLTRSYSTRVLIQFSIGSATMLSMLVNVPLPNCINGPKTKFTSITRIE